VTTKLQLVIAVVVIIIITIIINIFTNIPTTDLMVLVTFLVICDRVTALPFSMCTRTLAGLAFEGSHVYSPVSAGIAF